jgi:hypothetical protein
MQEWEKYPLETVDGLRSWWMAKVGGPPPSHFENPSSHTLASGISDERSQESVEPDTMTGLIGDQQSSVTHDTSNLVATNVEKHSSAGSAISRAENLSREKRQMYF